MLSRILRGTKIAALGDLGKFATHDNVKKLVEANGGTWIPDLSGEITHLVTSKEEWTKQSPERSFDIHSAVVLERLTRKQCRPLRNKMLILSTSTGLRRVLSLAKLDCPSTNRNIPSSTLNKITRRLKSPGGRENEKKWDTLVGGHRREALPRQTLTSA
jgi:hypothetical protein